MLNDHQIIDKPLLSEKSSLLGAMNTYVFLVNPSATKEQIRQLITKRFKVGVVNVRTANFRGKVKRRARSSGKLKNFKKAYITLKDGDKIELFEGV